LSEPRKLLVAFLCAIGAIVIVGVLQFNLVWAAQTKVASDIGKIVESSYTYSKASAGRPPAGPTRPSAAELATLQTHQVALIAARNATAVLHILAVFFGCLAVAYFSRTIWSSVSVAFLGWATSGIVIGALTRQALTLSGPPSVVQSAATAGRPTPSTAPFALYLVLGLASVLIWQTLLPWLLGWFIGSRVRSWRSFAVDFGPLGSGLSQAQAYSVADGPADRSRCSCGAVNLSSATSCYACDGPLGMREPLTPDGAKSDMWRASRTPERELEG